ncbi:MAG: UTP--glucose-1-phosphate uridylyltransferase [Vicinamibacteria bacterium]|nr:UTP--glucose-1-phosphate uridylyltransferase [Vicinamibacteria bacterium]
MSAGALLRCCEELERFRREAVSLYDGVRSALFLYAAYRFFLQESTEIAAAGPVPAEGHCDLLAGRYESAIRLFRQEIAARGPHAGLFSALAEAYRHRAFQTLAAQVRHSVRASQGNQWMFRVGHPADHPVRFREEMLDRGAGSLLYPILSEATPVRLDLSHSGWSDIFFLGMDYPEGARVINVSVDLGLFGRDAETRPPINAFVRAIPEPLLRLTSLDLGVTKDVTDLDDLFNFGKDHLGLLKAGVIASGLIPPSFEGTGHAVSRILGRVVGPGMGVELVTEVNDIPKGSRLAVSTNLLASIVSVLMRATGQTLRISGPLEEPERRLAASRAILGEWLGGSGGGWQDSGGLWPGIKLIEGAPAREGDPEFGVSRGCLLPRHHVLSGSEIHPETAARLTESLVLLHGGMAQNVGPILEMVTEKYLLRGEDEWRARQELHVIFDEIRECLRAGDVRRLADCTTRNWNGPLKTIIPWVTNAFTETIIARARERLASDFWGFLMLGGMSGGGMAMFVAPSRRASFQHEILEIMRAAKGEMDDALPFAMDPVVYDFHINQVGSSARFERGSEALLPARYYGLHSARLVRENPETISYLRRAELDHFTARLDRPAVMHALLRTVVGRLFRVATPAAQTERLSWDAEAERIRREHGFDHVQHEQLRADLQAGRIGLAHNRLSVDTVIEDVGDEDVMRLDPSATARGEAAIRDGRVAVLTLAGGVGSRWTAGAGVIKAVNTFVEIGGRHRGFLEIHLSKTRRLARRYGVFPAHVVSTSFLTHGAVESHLIRHDRYGYQGPVLFSPGRSIAQRLVPMVRDLVFLWEETAQETLDEPKQKVRDAIRDALKEWACVTGEGGDYTDNLPFQRFNPPGHWYEFPNLIRNGVLARLLAEHPRVDTLLLHNVDTVGADVDPAALGLHLASGGALTFEVVPRRTSDHGGGLARVNGRVRLLEGLAQPREEDELRLRFYNSMTTWIAIDPLLALFGLARADLDKSENELAEAVRRVGRRLPTYVTIKEVKRRWGHGQEDVFPVVQFEKLWSDMTSLPEVESRFLVVPRMRGRQLKSPGELDAWVGDGSKAYVESLCEFA